MISAALLHSAAAGHVVPELGRFLATIGISSMVDAERELKEVVGVEAVTAAATVAGAVLQFGVLTGAAHRVA